MANATINLFLPPELWDLILEFLPITELEKIKLLSSFFFDLIDLNRGFRCKILLCKNGQGNRKIVEQFQWAAANGHLDVLKWLHSTFELTGEDVRDGNNNYAFRLAAENGHLKVLKWLYSIFELTGKYVESDGNLSLKWVADNGEFIFARIPAKLDPGVLQWLESTF